MKKRLLKLLKVIVGILLLFVAVLIIALYWPLPDLKAPKRYEVLIIKSINVINVQSGEILANQDIVIQNNRIKSIDSSGPFDIKADLIIDGNDKFVIPGLWDMHTHSNQHSPWLHHPLYIANGVTGVRDMSGQLNEKDSYWVGSNERLKWNKELFEGKRISPRYILQSSYQMDGASSVPEGFPEYFKLETSSAIDSLLSFYKNENVDFIKIYQQILPESYRELAIKAPVYGLHLAGHKPMFLNLEDAINLGQRSFEHGRIFMFESFPKADSLRMPQHWKSIFKTSKNSMVEDFNAQTAVGLMQLMKEKNAYWTPTLQTLKFEAFAHKDSFLENPNLKYITWARKRLWWNFDIENNQKRNRSPESKGVSTAFYLAARKQVVTANEIGVPIMAGTDVTDSYIFAGFSIHSELEDLTKSGLSNLEALQSATIVPAKYAGLEMHYGTVEEGKKADLIILDKNPLKEITNSKTISAIIIDGILYDSDKIRELKTFTESITSNFHMNVKVIHSFVMSPLIRVQFAD
ncbi:amidohydrolase family protein [Flagellimonas lutaonensis]|uniref:Metal-dependent amidohydrolase, putative n=1 Tax=Flagellimonas lutaonensis TaxID=516051 RepID=A0A0D5YU13_9FLAO|nr:amidohydrolase family protein [Allomuricauda lutaonensis]AKA35376.1 Metal-dependent amidohydrolase, putative [Allomuricauda lutaonensis]